MKPMADFKSEISCARRRRCRGFIKAFLATWVVFFSIPSVAQQNEKDLAQGSIRVQNAVKAVVKQFNAIDRTALDVLSLLNRVSDVPINAELRDGTLRMSISAQDVALGDILDEFSRKVGGRILRQANCINIISNEIPVDGDYPLNINIESFNVDSINGREAAQKLFTRPEITSRKFYVILISMERAKAAGRPVKLNIMRATPRDILNAIAEVDGNLYWSLVGSGGERYFSMNERSVGGGR